MVRSVDEVVVHTLARQNNAVEAKKSDADVDADVDEEETDDDCNVVADMRFCPAAPRDWLLAPLHHRCAKGQEGP